ncbi:MAG TPA: alpha/beta fold hydrolase [Planctomycetota bacterium]|nr:alpha/beta fold hydrolase [Planctomycetota bacterium]
MPETPLYIPTPAGPLFAVLHTPDGDRPPATAALLLAPGGDEKRAAHGAMARLARTLCTAGAAALRFDCRGTGDSAGEAADVTLESMEQDATAAADFLRARSGGAPLVLVGVRLGASLALRLGPVLGAARVVAVAPILSGATWLRQERGRTALRRSMIARELAAAGAAPGTGTASARTDLPAGAEDLAGMPIGAEMIAGLGRLDLLAAPAGADAPETLIVQVSPRRTPLSEIARLGEAQRARVECLNLEPFWQPLESPDVGPLAELIRPFAAGGAS